MQAKWIKLELQVAPTCLKNESKLAQSLQPTISPPGPWARRVTILAILIKPNLFLIEPNSQYFAISF